MPSTALATVIPGPAIDPPKSDSFTPALYQGLQAAFSFFNIRFFDRALPDVVLTLQRRAHSKGHFTANIYSRRHGRDVPRCEVNLIQTTSRAQPTPTQPPPCCMSSVTCGDS
jgi:hypothetical protein